MEVVIDRPYHSSVVLLSCCSVVLLLQVMTIKDTGSADTHAAQKLLYTTIRVGCEGLGVELDRPEGVYASVRRTSSAKVLPLPPLPPPPPPVPVNAAPPSIPNNRLYNFSVIIFFGFVYKTTATP